jgi:hypothetical protein
MNSSTLLPTPWHKPPPGYEAAMADIERRALRGELTLAQARQEVFTVRERFAVEPFLAARWAAIKQ